MNAENQELYARLQRGPVDAQWSDHAKERARELVHQGIPISHISGAIENPSCVYWSDKYQTPNARYGDVTVAYQWDVRGYPIVVTVLPGTREAWDKVHASGLVSDREWRENPFR